MSSEGISENADVSRRTWLAAERTWLAWWRSGVTVGALALAVGKLLPEVTHHERWPLRLLGLAYGLLSVAILLVGAHRQRRARAALHRGGYEELSSPLVSWFTAVAVIVAVGSTVLVLATV